MKVSELYAILKRLPSDCQVLVEVNGKNLIVDRVSVAHAGHPAVAPVSSLTLVPLVPIDYDSEDRRHRQVMAGQFRRMDGADDEG